LLPDTKFSDVDLISPQDLTVGPESVEKSLSRACENLDNLKACHESLGDALLNVLQHLRQETTIQLLQRAYLRISEEFEATDTDELLSALHHIDAAMRIFGVLPSFDSSCRMHTLKKIK